MGVAEGGRVLRVKLSEEAVKAALVGENARVPRFLEELEGDLCDDALEDPAGLLVEGHDLSPSFCLCSRFGGQLSL